MELCEKQFYYFQNLINNNKFNKEVFDNLNLLNFKFIDDSLDLFDKNIKDFRSHHILNNFSKFCKESNCILKEKKIINNENEPNDYEKKFYEIFSQFKTEDLQNENFILTNKLKTFKYFVFYKIDKFGFLKFIKENLIYISNLNKNKNNELIEFYNEKDKFFGKWMNFDIRSDNNNNNLDIFQSVSTYIGRWKKLNFNGKIIDCFFGYKNINEFNPLINEKESLNDFFENSKEKIDNFKYNTILQLNNVLKENTLKKKTLRKGIFLTDYNKKEIKYKLNKKELLLIQKKNKIIKGEYKNNNFNGYSEIHYKNGDIFKGEIKDGKKNGFGIFYKAYYQIWDDDEKIFEKAFIN